MIRRATVDEAALLTTIALDAKRYWGYPEHWIKHWEADLTITAEFIRDNHVYVVENDGVVRGFYALCVLGEQAGVPGKQTGVPGKQAELEHMWVAPDYIGTGVGKELFLDAMERAAALEVRGVEISADPNAAGFYERMGARQIGEVDAPMDGQPRKLPRLKIEPT